MASRWTIPWAGGRDVAERLPILMKAANPTGFKQASMAGKEYLSVHQEKKQPLKSRLCISSQAAPAARREITGQE